RSRAARSGRCAATGIPVGARHAARAAAAVFPSVIRLQALTLSRGGRVLLDRVDAVIGPGERIALIGQNGTGKTTLLSALAGELPPDSGEIVQPWRDVIRLEQALPSSPLPAWR